MVRLEVLEPATWIAGNDPAAGVRLVESRVVTRDEAGQGLVRRDGAALASSDRRRAPAWAWSDPAAGVRRVPLRRIPSGEERPDWTAGLDTEPGVRSRLLDVRV